MGKLEAAPPLWLYALALFLIGWVFQFIGHAFEVSCLRSPGFQRSALRRIHRHSANQVCARPEATGNSQDS